MTGRFSLSPTVVWAGWAIVSSTVSPIRKLCRRRDHPYGRLPLPRVLVQQGPYRPPAQPPGPLNLALAVDVVGDAEQHRRPPLRRDLAGPALDGIALDEGESALLAPAGVLPTPLRNGVQQLRLAGTQCVGSWATSRRCRISGCSLSEIRRPYKICLRQASLQVSRTLTFVWPLTCRCPRGGKRFG